MSDIPTHADECTQTQTLGDLTRGRPTEYTLVCQATGQTRRLMMSTRTTLTETVWLIPDGQGVRLLGQGQVLVNGHPAGTDPLQPGDVLECTEGTFVLHRSPVLAYLEGLTPPHKGDCWPLDGAEVCMGRSGKRDNTISLTDKSVSREQARLCYSKGRFVLTAEAKCTVNGRPAEGKVVLRNGDLLGFGRQLLRFQSAQDSFGTGKGSIFFCDVWDYSRLFCDRAVQDVATQMNEFYEVAGEAVESHNGLVLRYVGDALLAAFSEIGHADAAVAAGINLQQRLLEKNQNWLARGLPALQVGVGISSGEFAMGHMGFGGYIEFGALGQDVNMAARIEKLTRDNGAKILIAAATQELLREPLSTRWLGAFSLKGLEADVEVFEVLLQAAGLSSAPRTSNRD